MNTSLEEQYLLAWENFIAAREALVAATRAAYPGGTEVFVRKVTGATGTGVIQPRYDQPGCVQVYLDHFTKPVRVCPAIDHITRL